MGTFVQIEEKGGRMDCCPVTTPVAYDGDRFDTIYVIGDLHADVGLTMRIFRDKLHLVNVHPDGHWHWVGGPRICVVVCGDVTDRSRNPNARSTPGENEEQQSMPDDLHVLLMLNRWAELAVESSSLLIRLLGNHDVLH